MFRSATFKLTMWYLALAMAISLTFSFALYSVTTHELSLGLRRETQRIYSGLSDLNNLPTALSDVEYTASAHTIWLRLVSFNAIVFVGSGFASYLLAKRTLQPIEKAHEQQKRFTADVSHELRTPLTAIRMENEVALMNKKSGAGELRETLKSTLEETAKMESLINNLLRLTQLEAGELQSDFTTVNVKKITKQAVKQVANLAKVRGIAIGNQAVSANVDGDGESLQQLLVILLDNAIKYSPDRSKILVTARRDTESIVIDIIDKGIGIDQESIDRVFDRFYRADTSRSNHVAEGTGLGLSIAKTITDLHNGNLAIASEVGTGTTVTIRLPKHQI